MYKKSLPPAVTSRILKEGLRNFSSLTVTEFRAEMLRVRPSIVAFICTVTAIMLLLTGIRSWRRGVPCITTSYE